MNLCGSGALAMAAKRPQQCNNQKQESLERVLQTDICTLATLISLFYDIFMLSTFLPYFQGGKMNKNWNPIEMTKYFSPCQLWDCSGISQIGFTFSHRSRCEDEDRNKCNREQTFTLFKRLRKHYFWPVGEERKYSTCLNNWSSVSSPIN